MRIAWAAGFDISLTPVRGGMKRGSSVNDGWHRTNKHPDGFLYGESSPELTFLMLAEIDPNISVMTPQPTTYPYSHDGQLRQHTPDFAVIERGSSLMFEVKSDRQYARDDLKAKLRSAARSCEARGWPYYVALRGDMESDPRFPQAESLWRRHRRTYTELQRLAVEEALRRGPRPVSDVVGELAGRMGDDAPETRQVLSLAANACIFIDLDQPIGAESLVRRADPAELPEPLLPRRRPADDLPWGMQA